MSEKYLIVADDFTGSNDTGVQLKNRGIDISVVFHSEDMEDIESSVVLDTESRGMEKKEAYQYVASLMKEIDFSDYSYVIKKVDSTLRGNVAEEINAISAQAQKSSYEGLERILKALEKAKVRLNANVNFELTMELLMLTIKEN